MLTNALTDDGPLGRRARAELGKDPHWAAPEHLFVEVFSAVRGRWLGGKITELRAAEALESLAAMVIDPVDTPTLLPRMWQLRSNVTGYDAAYVAAAEANRCDLVTADERLARTPGVSCRVVLAVSPAASS